MKSFCIIFFCLLTSTLYLSSSSTKRASSSSLSSSSDSDSSRFVAGRRPMRELSISMFDHPYEGRKIKVVKERVMRSKIQGVSEEGDHQNGDQLLYQVDYHGVTTHPTPTPKHPKP